MDVLADVRDRIRNLQRELDELRRQYGISARNEVYYSADRFEDRVICVADGEGGASLEIVEGNYPVDYTPHHVARFADEGKAAEAANRLTDDESDNYWTGDDDEFFELLFQTGEAEKGY